MRIYPFLLALAVSVMTLVSCTRDSYGFSGESIRDGLVIGAEETEITIRVELDEDYEAADDFEQKAFLRVNGVTHTSAQSGLDDPFVLPVDKGDSAGQLELLLGFCHSSNKEVCFVDRAVLAIEREESHDNRLQAPPALLSYRPRPPQ